MYVKSYTIKVKIGRRQNAHNSTTKIGFSANYYTFESEPEGESFCVLLF